MLLSPCLLSKICRGCIEFQVFQVGKVLNFVVKYTFVQLLLHVMVLFYNCCMLTIKVNDVSANHR